MSTIFKTPTIMIHPLDDANNGNICLSEVVGNKDDTTHLLPHRRSSDGAAGAHTTPHQAPVLSYGVVIFLMVNRSINLVLYKAFTTFSYYFSQYFGVNYTMFALIAVMNFPGNLLNIAVVPYYHQYKVRYVVIVFEVFLAACCLLILPWNNVAGLLVVRLMTGFAITAVRSEVNATLGAFTQGTRRRNAISIVEMSFGFSAMGFLVVGTVLEYFGWRTFFAGSAVLIGCIAVGAWFIIPAWHMDHIHHNAAEQLKTKAKKKYSYAQLREVLRHKRLQFVFVSIFLNKVARNAFYYTFSKWLYEQYGLGPQQAGYVTLTVAAGCLVGTTVVPFIVRYTHMSVFSTCFLGAAMQVVSMSVEPVYVLLGDHIHLSGACVVIFFYFCGCQIWYNNMLDIMSGVTPRPVLLPAVNTLLLAYGAGGGMIGTIGSTVWYEWGGEAGISLICAASNVGVCCIVVLLWIANKQHPYLAPAQTQTSKVTPTAKTAATTERTAMITPKKSPPQNYQSVLAERTDEGDDEDYFAEDRAARRRPQVIADSSSMALRIIGGETENEKSKSNLLGDVDEHHALIHQDNDVEDANRI